MKLNYQTLKQLILEQLQASDSIAEPRGLLYSPGGEDLIRAYDIYQTALENPRSEESIPIIDYFQDHLNVDQEAITFLSKPEIYIEEVDAGREWQEDGIYFYKAYNMLNGDKGNIPLGGVIFEPHPGIGYPTIYMHKDYADKQTNSIVGGHFIGSNQVILDQYGDFISDSFWDEQHTRSGSRDPSTINYEEHVKARLENKLNLGRESNYKKRLFKYILLGEYK